MTGHRIFPVFIAVGVCLPLLATCFSLLAADFKPLQVAHPVTDMAISEDGRYALILHQTQSLITVWDIKEEIIVKTVSCKFPRHLICRGGKVLVANAGDETVSVFSSPPAMKLEDQVGAGPGDTLFLSAPQEKYFDGWIITTGYHDGMSVCRQINIKDDVYSQLPFETRSGSVARSQETCFFICSYDGKQIVKQTQLYGNETQIEFFKFNAAPRQLTPSCKLVNLRTYFLWRQAYPAPYWFGSNHVCHGIPPKETYSFGIAYDPYSKHKLTHEYRLYNYIVPDVKAAMIYGLSAFFRYTDRERLNQYRPFMLNRLKLSKEDLVVVGSLGIKFPTDILKFDDYSIFGNSSKTDWSKTYRGADFIPNPCRYPWAVTLDDEVFFFLNTPNSEHVFYLRAGIDSFVEPSPEYMPEQQDTADNAQKDGQDNAQTGKNEPTPARDQAERPTPMPKEVPLTQKQEDDLAKLVEAIKQNDLMMFRKKMLAKPSPYLFINPHNTHTILTYAIELDRAEMVKSMLDNNADPNFLPVSRSSEYPLIIAVGKNHFDISKMLIERGANVNIVSNAGRRAPLFYAKNVEMAELLLNHGAELDNLDSNGNNVLQGAISSSPIISDKLFKFFVAKGIKILPNNFDAAKYNLNTFPDQLDVLLNGNIGDINMKDYDGQTLLHRALRYKANNFPREFLFSVLDKGVDVNLPDKRGHIPLMFTDEPDVIQALIKKGADVNALCGDSTVLMKAVSSRNFGLAKFLISCGADVNIHNAGRNTSLFLAIESDVDMDMVKLLVDNGADVNISIRGMEKSLLYYAMEENEIELAKYLIEHGADVNYKSALNHTVLAVAVHTKDPALIDYLIKHGARYSRAAIKEAEKLNLLGIKEMIEKLPAGEEEVANLSLHAAIERGNNRALSLLLEQSGADVNLKDVYGNPPLIIAMRSGNSVAVEMLLKKKADPTIAGRDGKNAIYMAAISKDAGMFRVLIGNGVVINPQDPANRELLHNVCSADIAELLVRTGADVNGKDKSGCTPLNCIRSKDIAEILVSAGADINNIDKSNSTPLAHAIYKGDAELVKYLLDHGAKTTWGASMTSAIFPAIMLQKDANSAIFKMILERSENINVINGGDTPLTLLLKKGDCQRAMMIMQLGADITLLDSAGCAPIHYAAANAKCYDALKLLIANKADVNARGGSNEWTPIHHAVSRFISADSGRIGNNTLHNIQLLLINNADINTVNKSGDTPLAVAAKNPNRSLALINFLIKSHAKVTEKSLETIKDAAIREIVTKNGLLAQ